jgi:voltage-gated potassium channel
VVGTLRQRVHVVVFGSDTRAGRAFDVVLIVAILTSLFFISLESVRSIREGAWAPWVYGAEWAFTVLFSIEYLLRLWCARSAIRYARSFFGIIDLVSILPSWIALFVPGAQAILAFRAFRLLRIFRVLKLVRFLGEASVLGRALMASRFKITVFLGAVLCVVMVMGSLMYLIEGPEHGFTSIPRSMFWAIVTMTTVGYGTIAPEPPLGQLLASALMILGYGVLAVPTGIVSAELVHGERARQGAQWSLQPPRDLPRPGGSHCAACGQGDHAPAARFCHHCGSPLG